MKSLMIQPVILCSRLLLINYCLLQRLEATYSEDEVKGIILSWESDCETQRQCERGQYLCQAEATGANCSPTGLWENS